MIDQLLRRILRMAATKGLRHMGSRQQGPGTQRGPAPGAKSAKQAVRALRTARRFGKF